MQQVSCLGLLDLSAAFNTLDHSILLHRLSTWFAISSVSVQWFTSYHSYLPHFSDKSSKLHFNLQTNPFSTPAHSLTPSPSPLLHSFTPTTLLEIDNLLSQSSNSYGDLDPVPTTVLKQISNAISQTILSIVNLSITTGTFPSTLESSIISPLLKILHSMRKICLHTAPPYFKPLLHLQTNREDCQKAPT